MAKNKITIDITSDLHSLVKVDCLYYNCKYHQRGTLNCNLKHIVINASVTCASYEQGDYEQ